MRLVAVMLARNSAWVIGASARAAIRWCDALVIFDHASTDATGEIAHQVAAEHPRRVVVLREDSPVWEEMDHRQRTLDAARELGATHIANVDDDEILTRNVEGPIRDQAAAMSPGEALEVPWISVWDGTSHYRDDDSRWSRAQVHLIFALTPQTHYRRADDGYQHHSRRPRGDGGKVLRPIQRQSDGGLMHLQFASHRRLLAKQALYKVNEILRWPGRATVAEVNRLYDGTTLDVPRKVTPIPPSWKPGDELEQLVDLNAEPWHDAECRRLVALHGAATFAGLDLYGVA